MLTYARWQYAIILIVLLFSGLYALPNVFPQDPSVQVTANRGSVVDEGLRSRIQSELQAAGVTVKSVDIDDGDLLVRLPSADMQVKAADTLRPELGNDYVVALNLASTVPDWLDALGAKPMLLGLDLQGGVHFTMQVDQAAALQKRLDATAEDIRVLLRENRVRYQSVERRPDGTILATLPSPADAARASWSCRTSRRARPG